MSKLTKKQKPTTAEQARTVVRAIVDSPYGGAKVDHVERVIDTPEAMKNRRQLTLRQYDAAMKYRSALDTVNGSIGNTMDPERIKVAPTGRGPGDGVLAAAAVLLDADKTLLRRDGEIILLVAGIGFSVEESAGRIYGTINGKVRQRDIDFTGRILREGLDLLADMWFGGQQSRASVRSDIRSFIAKGGKAKPGSGGEVSPGRVAMASKGEVKWNG